MNFDYKNPEAWKGVSIAVISFLVMIGVVDSDFGTELQGETSTAIGAVFALIYAIASLLQRDTPAE